MVLRFALPNGHDPPTQSTEQRLVALIADYVAVELGLPVLHPRLRIRGVLAARVPMPETPVDHDDGAVSWKDDVGTTREVLSVKAKTKTESVSDSANHQFWRGVPTTDARHDLAPLIPVDSIGHRSVILHRFGNAPNRLGR